MARVSSFAVPSSTHVRYMSKGFLAQVLSIILRGLLAEPTQPGSFFDRWKKDLAETDVHNDYDDLIQNGNSLYSPKKAFLSSRLSKVKRRNILYAQTFCPCESQYEIRDLGEGYYPRYLTISYCKPKACRDKFNSCRLLKYKVHILSRRNTSVSMEDESYVDESTSLPESLRYKWQLKPMYVAVACVTGREGRKN